VAAVRHYEDPSRERPRRRAAVARPTDTAVGAGAAGLAWSPGAVARLQRLAGNAAVSRLAEGEATDASPVLGIVGQGGGRPLEPRVQADMEGRLGGSFGDVRIHTDGPAAASARAVDAKAYTVDNEIVFDEGAYHPSTAAGRRTIAHELTHVIQQRSGPVDGTPAEGGIRVSDPSNDFEQEAERHAERAVSAAPEAGTVGAPGAVLREAQDSEVQRDDSAEDDHDDEDEDLQALSAQRVDAAEEAADADQDA